MLAAPLVCLTFNGPRRTTFTEVLWTFSIILESVCVLPQLMLLRQTTVPTVIDSFYLVTLGSYRAFYILNWIYRAFSSSKPDAISVIFGIVQTAFYVDFAWVYWTRQRVKLRGGGVVDADDMRKGWLVNRVMNPNGQVPEEDAEAADTESGATGPQQQRKVNRWGARGISISADDTLQDHDKGKVAARSANLEADPMLTEDAFVDDEDDDVTDLDGSGNVLNSDGEWRDSTSSK